MSRRSPTSMGIIIVEYIRKYPTTSSRELGKILFSENPNLFKSESQAYDRVRYYRGITGKHNRMLMNKNNLYPKISIPKSEELAFTNYTIDNTMYPIVVGSDAHLPYHNEKALEIFFDECRNEHAKTIIFNGDWLDCYQVSNFVRDPRRSDIGNEIRMLKRIMMDVRREFPDTLLIFKLGNHEERIDDYVMAHAPEIFHISSTHFENILKMDDPEEKDIVGFDKLDIKIVTDKRPIKIDHLYILHGHEYKFSMVNPVNPARGLYLKTKKSSLCGHFHQTSEHTETSIGGDMVSCWSTGCLCSLTPQYMPLNKWNLGFAVITKNDNFFRVSNRKIINGRIV